MQLTMNAHNLTIANLADKGESRFTLAGIQVTPTYTAVTDGHCLMKVTNPDIPADGFPIGDALTLSGTSAVLSTEHALALAKSLPKKTTIPVLSTVALCSNGALDEDGKPFRYVVANDLENVTKKPVMAKANFPDIDRVIPSRENMDFAITVNAALLADILQQLERMNKNKANMVPVTMYFQAPRANKSQPGKTISQAIRMESKTDAGQDVTSVLMPVRGDADDAFWTAKWNTPKTEGRD